MGLSQSKAQQEPVIFINPNVPVQFTSSFINTLEKNVEKAPEALKSRQVEALVQIRVNEELEKMKLAESEISSTLATKEPPTIKTNHDLDATLKKIQRVNAKEVPAIIKEQQDKLVACYKENEGKSLNCWQQARDFKQAVLEEQKKFISRTQ